MPTLKVGTWKINGNGAEGELFIESIDAQGKLGGKTTVYKNSAIGFWDEPSRKITFMRLTSPTQPQSFQAYTGYLMNDNQTIAGWFEAFGTAGGGTAQRSVFGWFARLQ